MRLAARCPGSVPFARYTRPRAPGVWRMSALLSGLSRHPASGRRGFAGEARTGQPPGGRGAARAVFETRGASIAKYRDVNAAVAAAYRSFPPEPGPADRIIHFVHQGLSRREAREIDVARPGALLYERAPGGGLRLVGAMFTAPVGASLEELDARVPLSVTQWHLHQNICVPRPVWDREAWARRAPDGRRPLFGPGSPVSTEAACREAGGRFLPTVFGWMAHVYPLTDNPAGLRNAMYGHEGHGGADHHHH